MRDPAKLAALAKAGNPGSGGKGGGNKAPPFGKKDGGGQGGQQPPKKGPPQPPPKKPAEDDADLEGEDDEGGDEPEGDDEHAELVSMVEADLDELESTLDEMDKTELADQDSELSEDSANKLTNVLDTSDDQLREHVRDISWDDAAKVASQVEGATDPEELGALLYRLGQIA